MSVRSVAWTSAKVVVTESNACLVIPLGVANKGLSRERESGRVTECEIRRSFGGGVG